MTGKITKTLSLVMFLFLLPVIAMAADGAGAHITEIKGMVLVRPVGDFVWQEATENMELNAGDFVKTRESSTVVITLSDNSFFKLLPLSIVVLADHVSETGVITKIVSIARGRSWIKMDEEDESGQFVLKAENAFVKGKRVFAFVETDAEGGTCIDLASGSAAVRAADSSGVEKTIADKQRILVTDEAGLSDPVELTDITEETAFGDRTCLPQKEEEKKDDKKQESGAAETASTGPADTETGGAATTGTTSMSSSVEEEGEYFTVTLTTVNSINFEPEQTTAGTDESGAADVASSTGAQDTGSTDIEEITISSDLDEEEGSTQAGATESMSSDVEEEEEYFTVTLTTVSSVNFQTEEKPETGTDEEMAVASAATENAETGSSETGTEPEEDYPEIDMVDTSTGSDDYEEDSGSYEEAADEEPEYMEVTVSFSTSVSFESAETETSVPAGPCEEYPEISEVTVSDEEVEDVGEVMLESELPCDFLATATVRWTVSSECAGVKSVSISEGEKAPIYFDGADAGDSNTAIKDYRITDYKKREMTIKAEGGNGKISFFTFTIKPQGQYSAAVPQVSDVLVNGLPVSEDGSLFVQSMECGAMPVTITGSLSSECGEIEDLTVELDGGSVPVRGKDSWRVTQSFAEDTSFSIMVKATDDSGRDSEPYEFDVELERVIVQPELELQTIGGAEANPFGDELEIYRNDLVDGKLQVKGAVYSDHCPVAYVEVTNDDSSSWGRADGTNSWTYGFIPQDGTYEINARAYDVAESESYEIDTVEIIYSKYTLEEKLLMAFNDMMQAYKDMDVDAFMEYVDPSYSSESDTVEDVIRLETSLNDKFSEQSTVYIRYQDTQHIVSGITGRVTFSWDCNPNTSGYSHTATFVYTKTDEGWKFTTVQDTDTFLRHTDKAAYLSLQSDQSSLLANGEDTATITAEVRDSAYNPVADFTRVTLQASSGTIVSTTTTSAGIAQAEYTSGHFEGTITIQASSNSVTDSVTIITVPDSPPGPPE